MKLSILFLLLFTLSLHADPSLKSALVLDNENYALKHESTYGVTNNYAVVHVEHQIKAKDYLLFHYGTRFGLVIEDYTAENGFGPNAEAYGFVMQASVGMDYILQGYQTISLEGIHSKNQIVSNAQSKIRFKYQFKF